MMNRTTHRPYEVIETEETITRYFNPYSKETTSCRDYETKILHKNNYQECPVGGEPKIVLKNTQFQDLYEKFNKLRMEMSSLTKKFKEINLSNAQAESNLCAFNDVATGHDLSNSLKTKFQSNPEELQNVAIHKDHGCVSRVSVASQTDQIEPKSSTLTLIDDKGKCRIMYGDKEYPFAYRSSPKRTDPNLLRKSKNLLTSLIDKELQRVHVQSSPKTLHIETSLANVPVSTRNSKQLKMECIAKITEELAVLKDLEELNG